MAQLVGCWVGFYGNLGAGAVPIDDLPIKLFFLKKQTKTKSKALSER